MLVIIKNNLIVCAIHIGVTIIMFFPHAYIYRIGGPFQGISDTIQTLIMIVFAFIIYFVLGKFLLAKTENVLWSILSVSMLFIIITLIGIFAYNTLGRLANLPFFPSIWGIQGFYNFLRGKYFDELYEKIIYIVIAALPSLAMWLGLFSKK